MRGAPNKASPPPIEEALPADPQNADEWTIRAGGLLILGRFAEAVEASDHEIDVAHGHPKSLFGNLLESIWEPRGLGQDSADAALVGEAVDVRFELIIFDCDGVLVDSEPIFNLAYAEVLNDSEFKITSQDLLDRFSVECQTRRCSTLSSRSEADRCLPTSRSASPPWWTRAAKSRSTTPGVHEALTSINLPVCVASSGTPDGIRTSLRIAQQILHFENTFSDSTVNNATIVRVGLRKAARVGPIVAIGN